MGPVSGVHRAGEVVLPGTAQLGLVQFSSAELRLPVGPCLNRGPDGIIRIGGDADLGAGERHVVDLA